MSTILGGVGNSSARSSDKGLKFTVFQSLRLAWADDDLRVRLMWVIGLFAVFTLGVHIQVPIPGVTAEQLTEKMKDNNFFQLLNSFGGGALRRLSVFSLGLNPYITASIIFQVLQQAIPAWKEEMKEGGEYARRAMNRRIRLFTLALCIGQSVGLIGFLSSSFPVITVLTKITVTIFWTCGSMFVLYLGEQISERGIGNGVSLMIFAGIVIALPQTYEGIRGGLQAGSFGWFNLLMFLAIFLVSIWFVVMFTVAQRRIPMQHMRRTQGTKVLGGQTSYLPLSVNMTGVIPIIFALSILFFPATLANLFAHKTNQIDANANSPMFNHLIAFSNYINPGNTQNGFLPTLIGALFFVLVIGFFTYFYTAIQYNVDDISDNLKRQGSFIPGIRPGKQTSDFLNNVISRLTLVGAAFLSAVTIIQFLSPRFTGITAQSTNGSYIVGGTTLLILVQVALDFMRQIESNLLMKQYGGGASGNTGSGSVFGGGGSF